MKLIKERYYSVQLLVLLHSGYCQTHEFVSKRGTAEIARRLGVAEKEIQQRVISKTKVDAEKSKLVDSVEDESE